MQIKHSSTDSIKGFIFEYSLLEMIKRHPDFSDVKHEYSFNNSSRPIDIVAKYKDIQYVIECKSLPAFSNSRLEEVAKELLSYRKNLPIGIKMVLAFPGELNSVQCMKLNGYMIDVWDIYRLADIFSRQISFITSEELKSLLSSVNKNIKTIEDDFIKQLNSCPKGHQSWVTYQKLCGDIFEHLFCPTLGKPITELSDYAKANRRDFIMANYSEGGFWYYLRQRYLADYIVLDAKNHSSKIEKTFILQMANYLKDYGPGLFGIIICRNGLKESAIHTQREVWVAQQKLIIYLNDTDLENMLLAKRNSNNPEEIIMQKIEDFRLNL